jgi:hypothetical protein
MPYPTDHKARVAERARIRSQAIAAADRIGRTLTCAESTDHSTCVGALNCLCECHDPLKDTL